MQWVILYIYAYQVVEVTYWVYDYGIVMYYVYYGGYPCVNAYKYR
jgi:hypothetical protein